MQPDYSPEATASHPITPAKRSIWNQLGVGSLSISVFIHLALLAIGVIWVFQVIPAEKEKVIDFTAKSGGGGSPLSESQARKQRPQILQTNLARVSATGLTSNIVLPELDQITQMTSVASLSSGGLAGGLGGTGTGGGRGTGDGPGIGSGVFAGMSNGSGTKNPFGALSLDPRALAGTFYDLKQTHNGKPTGLDVAQVQATINDFVNRGWKESTLKKFYQAPRTLYQSKLYIPMIDADAAPAAFDCEKEVEPSRWVVVYRGVVSPPRSGKYRFVGSADDVLVVRFNGKNVFDHGYYSGTTPLVISGKIPAMKEEVDDSQVKHLLRRDYPMEKPLKTYSYPSTPTLNPAIGGLAVGPEFKVEVGREYPIDILISELPGGKFYTSLLIQEEGVDYMKAEGGSPILPLFRLDDALPATQTEGDVPPYDPNGPVWKILPGHSSPDI